MSFVRLVGHVVAVGRGVVKGSGADEFVVCIRFDDADLAGKDHVNVFPNQWDSWDHFRSVERAFELGRLEVGSKVRLDGELQAYRRADGSVSSGLVDAHITVAVKRAE